MNSQIQEWKALREQGLTYQQIADQAGISKQGVWDALNKTGIPHKTKWSQYYEQWENMYRQGIGTNIIAKKFNCSQRVVYYYLSKKLIINRSESSLRAWKKRKKDLHRKKMSKLMKEGS